MAESSLLAGARGQPVEKPGRPVTAEIGHQHPPARGGERRSDTVIGVDIIGEAVQQDDRTTLRRPAFLVGDFERWGAEGFHGLALSFPCRQGKNRIGPKNHLDHLK
jgi:hypothetical protein